MSNVRPHYYIVATTADTQTALTIAGPWDDRASAEGVLDDVRNAAIVSLKLGSTQDAAWTIQNRPAARPESTPLGTARFSVRACARNAAIADAMRNDSGLVSKFFFKRTDVVGDHAMAIARTEAAARRVLESENPGWKWSLMTREEVRY